MHRRRVILAALIVVAAFGLLAGLVWPPRCPIKVRVAAVERSGMFIDSGRELLMVTLIVSNCDQVAVMFEAVNGFEAKSAEDDWMPMEQAFTIPQIGSGREASLVLFAPPATSACRLRLHYQTQIWKCRVMESLGLRGRTLVAKSRLLCKLVWPDELKTMSVPPRWRQTTIEAVIPENTISPSEPPKPARSDLNMHMQHTTPPRPFRA
jgi:hypothetical protein